MPSIRTLAGLAAVVVYAGAAYGQVDPAAKEKMDRMAAAAKAADSISYKVELKGEGGFMATMLPQTTLDVLLQRDPERRAVWRMRATGKRAAVAIEMGGLPELPIKIVSDGTKSTWIDEEKKTVMERFTASATSPEIMSTTLAALRELTEAEPFSKELAAPTMTVEAPMKADGVQCEVVLVDLGPGQSQSRWAIGPDHLPRRLERIMAGVGTQVWTLTEVKLNPPVPEGSFVMSKPEGYAFDPGVRPPAPAPESAGTVTKTAPRERALGTNLGDLAPDFELPTSDGKKVSLASLKGNVVVLDFFGTWSLSSKKSGPEMQKLAERYKDRPVKVFGLAVRESDDQKPISYMKDNGYTYGLMLKADEVAKEFRVKTFPTYFVIAPDGEITFMTSHFNDETFPRITAAIEQALAGSQQRTNEIKNDGEMPPPRDGGGDGAVDR